MHEAPQSAGGRLAGRRRAPAAALAIGICLLATLPAGGGTPTLTTITIDGSMGDWSPVLADPDNVVVDGPGGGLPDADSPSDPALDIERFAFTWDGTYLYFYLKRTATAVDLRYYWFFIDADNDGLMEPGEPVMRVRWRGSNGQISTRDDTYLPGNPAGDPSSLGGVHDGYTLPGTTSNGPAMDNLTGGTASGLEMESRYSWAAMGILPGSPIEVHVTSTSTQNAFPAGVEDNLGRSISFNIIDLAPDRSATTTPGTTAVFAHTLTNNGNVADMANLTWAATGSFTPAGVSFYRDADGSATLTPGDPLLVDTDGDGNPDAGPLPAGGGSVALLAAVATPAGAPVGSTATVTLTARSRVDPLVSEPAVDTLTLSGPALTLVKAASAPTIAPGGTLTYSVTWTNAGSEDAQNVVVVDPVPSPSVYVQGSASGAGAVVAFSHDGGSTYDASDAAPVTHLRWSFAAPIPPGATGALSFSVQVP